MIDDTTNPRGVEGVEGEPAAELRLGAWDRWVTDRHTEVTARLFGGDALCQRQPAIFDELTDHFARIVELALDEHDYRVEHDISEQLRSLADRLGVLQAGPRDVVELHHAALRGKLRDVVSSKGRALAAEGQFLLLELMGYLVSFYRSLSYGARAACASAARPPRRKDQAMTDKFLLKLYITGHTPRSEQAIGNLRRICDDDLGGRFEMVVIDVLERPQLAEDERILATPTLIKELPPPLRRLIGDLSDTERVVLGLDLRPLDASPSATSDEPHSDNQSNRGKTE